MDIAGLKAKVKGTLKLGSMSYGSVHSGNLVLDGSQSGQPIEINGEVLIDGDLIIKGVYKGIGTIYAKNIGSVASIKSYDIMDKTFLETAHAI